MAITEDSISGDDRTSSMEKTGHDPVPVAHTPPAEPPAATGPSLLALLAGGFLAAGIGFLAAYFTEFGVFETSETDVTLAEAIVAQEARLDEIETALGAPDETGQRLEVSEQSLQELRENLDSVNSRLGGVEIGLDAPSASAPDTSAIDALSASTGEQLTGLGQQLAALDERISGLGDRFAALDERVEANTGGPTEEEIAALEARMGELAAMVDTREAELASEFESQRAAIAGAEAAAATETSRISAQAGLSEIRAAVENGESFRHAVGTVESATGADVPEALKAVADQGVATVAELQARFPEASRDGLAVAVRETAGESPVDRFGAFLRAQTGARSLGEKPGDAPDAVLSRAGARLDEGDVAAALDELQALPEGGREAMGDWIDDARARVDAKTGVSELSQNLNTN